MDTTADYLAYLNKHLNNLGDIYARLEAAGVPLDGLEDLMPQVYSVVYATRTGWANGSAFTGAQRVSKHLIDKLKFFKTLSVSFVPSMSHDPEKLARLRNEIDSLHEFIASSGIPSADANMFMLRLEAASSLLDAVPSDYFAVAEHLSATLGLLAMYAAKIKDKAGKQAWQDRIKTAAFVLGGDLLVSLSTQAVTTGASALLGLPQ